MKRRTPILDGGALTAEIAGLSKASITDLRERWKTLYGKEPLGHIGRSLSDSGDRLPPPGRGFRRFQAVCATVLDRFGMASERPLRAHSETASERRDGHDPRVARRQSSRHRARQ